MPRYMLDTNMCIYLMKNQPEQVAKHFDKCYVGDVVMSAITFAELEYGIKASEKERSVFVYPNPVTDKFQIKSVYRISSVTISGLSGNIILNQSGISDYSVSVDSKNLAPGLYLLKIETSNGTITRKLVKSSDQ